MQVSEFLYNVVDEMLALYINQTAILKKLLYIKKKVVFLHRQTESNSLHRESACFSCSEL